MNVKMKCIEFAFAKPADETEVKSPLSECGLPYEDVSDHLRHFIVAKDSGGVARVD